MILAEKIVKLRKQVGWSQEELAEKLDVSRQSVSKWESANSIPDLTKIILLAEIFSVSTDYLLKDELEEPEPGSPQVDRAAAQITMDQAAAYVEGKVAASWLTTKGAVLCICSAVPMFFLMALVNANRIAIEEDVAGAIGVIFILALVVWAIGYFIKTNQYEREISLIEDQKVELSYGVYSAYQAKQKSYRPTYNSRLSAGIFFFIFSFAPLILVASFYESSALVLLMLVVLLVSISVGIYLVVPASAKYEAYTNILKDSEVETLKTRRAKRAEKLAAFYWPLVTAIYLGWSFWTMNWGITWIIWPVSGVLFGACVGLVELLQKDDRR